MAQPPASPTPNVLKPPIALSPPSNVPNLLFHPRKEFLRDLPRVVSSFSLLTLAGQGLVRLYSFPDSVINGLRRLFDQQRSIVGVRENTANNFFEFSLEHKPWSNVKSLEAEKLILSILSVIFQYGYSFLSTIEYSREQDDRIAIAFSRPTTAPVNSSIPVVPNGSVSTLPQASPMLFAISFPSTALLRVIDPPLPLTPAILQSVRNAWPRGIAYEKKIGESYEFKMKGYKWFQENTFSVDSLHQILTLLTALDRHSFTLLTSLTLGSRSRTRDLWIFTGPPSEARVDSPPASPITLNSELKHDFPSQHGGSPPDGHAQLNRSVSPHLSSPLKQVTPSHSNSSSSKLRKPFPKAQLPNAFQSDTSLTDAGRLPSDVGSVDMTGIGTARRNPGSLPHTPDVFYTTGPVQPGNTLQQEFNPWNRSLAPLQAPVIPSAAPFLTVPFGRQHSRHYSMSSTDDPLLRASMQESPYDIARQSSSTINTRLRRASSPLSGSPINLFSQPMRVSPSAETPPVGQAEDGLAARHSTDGVRPELAHLNSNVPRIPTPPLLSPGAFRDSAFSSSTGWRSTEIPITWTGKDPEPLANGNAQSPLSQFTPSRMAPGGPRERRASGGARAELQSLPVQTHPPLERRGSSGPVLPGAWAPTPQEERLGDVGGSDSDRTPPLTTSSSTSPHSSSMIPPTIKEQPSQEGDDLQATNLPTKAVKARVEQPEQHKAEGEGARKSEAAWVGNMLDKQPSPPPNGSMPKTSPAATNAANGLAATAGNGHASHANRPPNRRAHSISEGWVLVNIEGKPKVVPGQQRPGQGGLRAPPLKHQRSNSDSRLPTAHTLAQTTAGAGKSTMSPAAKAIVVVDAVGAKEAAKEKAHSGGKLRRLLGRSGDKSAHHTPEPSTSKAASPQPQTAKSKAVQLGRAGAAQSPPPQARQAPPQANGGSARVRK
ncbi:hypothetical protein L226DRAFT_565203 [Lentinus tigrinus ALCF2SS1-7]|uniref:uncharacterized protein n=1 Tax=Lentinus tigrinus ALCF2SS1-7 TaxID=1328758 RepID=UPI001165D3BB|nr:hypothetical protein L226DRAFT_565203 [Lentinus tigrinus ALCF2SS1-7]